MTDTRRCAYPDCGRPHYALGLCQAHWARRARGSSNVGPIGGPAVHTAGDVYMPCPDQLLALADACAELDARAIVRAIWPHLLEAGLAGLEPFTLDEAS